MMTRDASLSGGISGAQASLYTRAKFLLDESLPLLTEHVKQMLRIEVALPLGPQLQLARPHGSDGNARQTSTLRAPRSSTILCPREC